MTRALVADTLIATRGGPLDRTLVLASALALVVVDRRVLTPQWERIIDPYYHSIDGAGPHLFVGHALVWSVPKAVASVVALAFLVRTGRFRRPSLVSNLRPAVLDGLIAALGIVAITVAVAPLVHLTFGFHVNPWGLAGNVFSNGYEEIFYRGLIFTAGWYATGRAWAGALISGAVFGATHDQYPVPLRVLVGVMGAILSVAYARSGNFVAPWLAHQLADTVLDAIF
jgi:membrane protease YdiL (CAAX protease family)